MSIKAFIQEHVLLPRLQDKGVLVVYDADQRYHKLCLEMGTNGVTVIDAGESSISSREKALLTLRRLGEAGSQERMLIYVPTRSPRTDEEKQKDPFALYMTCGRHFPDGDGDEFRDLCLKAKPDFATEIRKLFAGNKTPDFAVVDAIAGGTGYPNLQALLGVESARNILFTLLAPQEQVRVKLDEKDVWVAEAKELFKASLGLKLITRGKTWQSVADELWRFLLFSEFFFDLPEALPESLAEVPRSAKETKPLVEDLCDRLRNDLRTQSIYLDRAEAIEKELNLPHHCIGLKDLGIKDTFPFEERHFLQLAMDALLRDNLDTVREIAGQRIRSVWAGKGESQAQWSLLRAALQLGEACGDYERQLTQHARSMDDLVDFYLNSLREVDRLHREFEQQIIDYFDEQVLIEAVIEKARNIYRKLAAKVHDIFIRHFEKEGYPTLGRLSNVDVFDKVVAPKIKESGRRVAFFLVDALRYELGVALQKQLADDGQVEFVAAFAQLPTATKIGMASLLPQAGKQLFLKRQSTDLIPEMDGMALTNVNKRMQVLQQRYGQRFQEMSLSEFRKSKAELPETVDLLVIRSTEIDSQMENDPESALGTIQQTLKSIRVAIAKLEKKGFQEVVIATDHGFFLNLQSSPGDVCQKPPGNWINVHNRLLLGEGSGDSANFILPTEQAGIRGDFTQIAGPRGLVTYRSGEQYFHGGVSLQECLVPVISLRFIKNKEDFESHPEVLLSYRNQAKFITTRLPVIDVTLKLSGLFAQESDFEILLEAHDKKGNVVGEAKAGGPVNPATGTLSLKLGERTQVPMKMLLDYEGKFTVKAMDPTTLAVYARIELETDYAV